MEPGTWGFIGTIVGAILGAAASIITTIISGKHTLKLQDQTDSFQRNERARTFQRANLLEVQELLAAYMRLLGRAQLEDSAFFRNNPDSTSRPRLSEQLNQEIMDSSRRLVLITERIENDEVRNEIKALHVSADQVLNAQSIHEGQSILSNSVLEFQHTMEKVGTALRRYY